MDFRGSGLEGEKCLEVDLLDERKTARSQKGCNLDGALDLLLLITPTINSCRQSSSLC